MSFVPEVKANVSSPFIRKFQQSGMVSCSLDVYIYSGLKDDGKGQNANPNYSLYKTPIPGNDYVIFDLTDLIKDEIEPTITLPLDSNKDYIKWVELKAEIATTCPFSSVDAFEIKVPKNTTEQITLEGEDPRDLPITFTITDPPNWGTLGSIFNKRLVNYTPDTGQVRNDIFRYTITNGSCTSSVVTVYVEIYETGITQTFLDGGGGFMVYGTSLRNALYNNYIYNGYQELRNDNELYIRNMYARYQNEGDSGDILTTRIWQLGCDMHIYRLHAGVQTFVKNCPDGWWLKPVRPWLNQYAPSPGPYEYDDLPQDLKDACLQSYQNYGGNWLRYLIAVRVQNGIIIERRQLPMWAPYSYKQY